MAYACKTIDSPVGRLTLVASDKGLAAVVWDGVIPRRVRLGPLVETRDHPVLLETERQLGAYFAGRLTAFTLPLDFAGTAFQKAVWSALLAIPFGTTKTYGQIARDLGKPNATRAVGAANGRNPIAIIAPCHRVIGASGTLAGFGGGLEAKAKLLAIEGRCYGEGVTGASREVGTVRKRRRTNGADTADLFAAR